MRRTYGEKKASGDMMYGPGRKVSKWPEFQPGQTRVLCDHPHHYEKDGQRMRHNVCVERQERLKKAALRGDDMKVVQQ